MKNHIEDFWEENAKKFKCDHKASWADIFMIKLEYDVISKFINNNTNVLDVGCANGFSTIKLAEEKNIKINGIDFSPTMIYYANENKINHKLDNIKFEIGDVRNINYPDNTFDTVYTTRVLINLPTWEEQKNGILECLRVTKNNGTVIICEGYYEPFIKLNSLRQVAGLMPLEEHDFNRYIKKYKIEEFLHGLKLNFINIDFSSVYYIGSRFLRELITDYKSFEGFTNPILEEFYNLEVKYSGGGFGIQQAYVIKKEIINEK